MELMFIVASYNNMHETYAVVVINLYIRSTHVMVYRLIFMYITLAMLLKLYP